MQSAVALVSKHHEFAAPQQRPGRPTTVTERTTDAPLPGEHGRQESTAELAAVRWTALSTPLAQPRQHTDAHFGSVFPSTLHLFLR